MKLKIKAFATMMFGVATLSPIVTFAADGKISSTLFGNQIAAEALGFISRHKEFAYLSTEKYYSVYNYSVIAGKGYSIAASCDDRYCVDLDLYVLDDNNNVVYKDEKSDTNPIITIWARWDQTYKVLPVMRGCRTASCEYGIQFFSN